MKKNAVKITCKLLCFLAIFCVLFLSVQSVFKYKGWDTLYIDVRLKSYQEAADKGEQIDVVALGSSPLFRGMVPMTMYHDTGMTVYNFGSSRQNAMCEYYLLKSVVKINVPKVVVLDLNSLFQDRKSDETFSITYYQTLDGLADNSIRNELIEAILQDNPDQNRIDLMFPLLRSHSEWESLDEADYTGETPDYKEYAKGCLIGTLIKNLGNKTNYLTEAQLSQETQVKEISEYSLSWYEKIISLCEENGIKVAVVSVPITTSGLQVDKYKTFERFCSENKIPYFNYATQEKIAETGISAWNHYHDEGHLNLRGGMRLSRIMARDFQNQFGFDDKRGDPMYADWDQDWAEFYNDYQELVDNMNQ